jgi:phosphatidylinositol alpha-1,6-mannosyltransferase
MHVLALVTDAFGGYGGIAQYNRDFITALSAAKQVQRITVLPRMAPSALEQLPPRCTQRPPQAGRIRYSVQALGIALTDRPDVVFSGHLYHGPLSVQVAKACGAKLISQLHGTEIWGALSPRHTRPLERSDAVLCVSRDTRRRVLEKANVTEAAAKIIPNTVGDDFIPGDRAAARARFSLGQDIAIVTVARLDTRDGYKGQDRIIPLIAALRQQAQAVTYLIAGIGADQQRLERLAESNGVTEHIRFLGKVPREALPDLYRAADLFALPSTGEGFGIAYLEAMACGTPAIGLTVGGAPDALGDGDLGACVAPEGFEAAFIAQVNSGLPRDQTLPARVRSQFGFDRFAEKVDGMLAELMRSPAAKPA